MTAAHADWGYLAAQTGLGGNVEAEPGSKLLLFITGSAPRSRRARENLSEALQQLGGTDAPPQEIDLVDDPAQALSYGIFATPALVRTSASGQHEILYGDLSEAQVLERFLKAR